MSLIYRFIVLEDAFHFLNQLRGLPDVPIAEFRRSRLIRSCMILSWVAVEEALEEFINRYSLATRPDFPKNAKLIQLIEYVARVNNRNISITDLEAARKLRNDVTHARPDAVLNAAITEENCRFVFETCLTAIKAMCRHTVECVIQP